MDIIVLETKTEGTVYSTWYAQVIDLKTNKLIHLSDIVHKRNPSTGKVLSSSWTESVSASTKEEAIEKCQKVIQERNIDTSHHAMQVYLKLTYSSYDPRYNDM